MADDSVGLVKSSYDDVNTALENLLGNVTASSPSVTMSQVNQAIAAASMASLPVGAPMMWPSSTIPTGFVLYDGRVFDKTSNPILASLFPSGNLADLRGVFLRGADNGRGIDPDSATRALMSQQGDAIRNITGYAGVATSPIGGAFYQNGTVSSYLDYGGGHGDVYSGVFDASRVVPTAAENRPVNVIMNIITRIG